MSAASNYTEQNVINALLRGVAFPLPTKTYIALHTADPGEDGASEVTTGAWPAYIRKPAEGAGSIGSGWSEPVNGVSKNAKQIVYPGFDSESPATVTHWSVWDAESGGNMLMYAALQTSRTMNEGDVFVFDINSLTASQA